MVRLKQRYLLLDILYPDPTSWPRSTTTTTSTSTTAAKPGATANPAEAQLRIHAPTADTLSPGLLAKLIREQVAELFGDWGVGRLGGERAGGVSVKYLSAATSTAIIRCPRGSFRVVWAALTFLSHVPDFAPGPGVGPTGAKRAGALTRPCVFRVVKVSGTMRKAEEEAMRRGRREVARVRGVVEGGVLGGIVGDSLGGADEIGNVDEDVDEDEEMHSDWPTD